MIPVSFEYERPSSVDEAVDLLSKHGDDAKLMAGGHSLLPLMKLRLSTPSVLVDLGRIESLRFIRREKGAVRVGAMTRYVDLERSEIVRDSAPLLARSMKLVGDMQVRNRGTIGGAIAHADPAGDVPCLARALGMTVHTVSPRGRRSLAADDFFVDIFTTPLEPDETITEIEVPYHPPTAHYEKFRRRLCDWAIVGSAVSLATVDGRIASARIALTNVGPTPVRAESAENHLAGRPVSDSTLDEAAELAREGVEPTDEPRAPASYKKHLVRVLTRRALVQALAQ